MIKISSKLGVNHEDVSLKVVEVVEGAMEEFESALLAASTSNNTTTISSSSSNKSDLCVQLTSALSWAIASAGIDKHLQKGVKDTLTEVMQMYFVS